MIFILLKVFDDFFMIERDRLSKNKHGDCVGYDNTCIHD